MQGRSSWLLTIMMLMLYLVHLSHAFLPLKAPLFYRGHESSLCPRPGALQYGRPAFLRPTMTLDLDGMTVKQLRDQLIALGESPSTKMRKGELIDMLQKSEVSGVFEETDAGSPENADQLTQPTDAALSPRDSIAEGDEEESWSEVDDSSDIPAGMFEEEPPAEHVDPAQRSSPSQSDAAAARFFEEEEEEAPPAPKESAEEEKAEVPEGFFEDASLSTRDVHSMTVPQLKEELRSHGLKVGGVKAQLQERLLDFLSSNPSASSQASSSPLGNRPEPGVTRVVGHVRSTAPGGRQQKPVPERAWGDNRKVFVWGLPFRSRPEDLVRLVEEQFGAVERVEGMFVFGRSTGRAWITFEAQDIAKRAANNVEEIYLGERSVKFAPPWARPSRQALREITAQLPRTPPPEAREPSPSMGRGMRAGDAPPFRERSAERYEERRPGSQTLSRSGEGSATLRRGSESPARGRETRFEERRTVFVGRIPLEADQAGVQGAMESYGRVKAVRMGMQDGEFQGFAHVEYADADAAALAVSSQVEILETTVKVNIAAEGRKDDREEAFPLPEDLHGVLIGVRGKRVRELEAMSGARIGFTLSPEPSMVVRGSPAQRRQAWQAAQRHLASAGTDTLPIPKDKWSVVIGARGARIRGLEEQTGAKLQLDEDPTPGLRVFGLPAERRAALAMVQEILEGEEEELFPVPAKYHGLLVGKRGMTVKELQRESGAFISLVKMPEPGMLVKGNAQQRDKAWGITQKLLDELPGVLAEIRGMEGLEPEGLEDLDEIGAESIYLDDGGVGAGGGMPVDGTEVVWEEAVARAVEKAKTAYKEERLEMMRAERGVA